jgi:hypothetical protein
MLVSGLLTPPAVFVRLSLRSPADWQQHFLLSGCGLPLLPAPRWFSLAVVCDAARLRAFIRSTTFSPFGRAFAVMDLCQTLAAVSKAMPPGNRTLFHSLGDHPLGIATRSTPTRQAIARLKSRDLSANRDHDADRLRAGHEWRQWSHLLTVRDQQMVDRSEHSRRPRS